MSGKGFVCTGLEMGKFSAEFHGGSETFPLDDDFLPTANDLYIKSNMMDEVRSTPLYAELKEDEKDGAIEWTKVLSLCKEWTKANPGIIG